MINTPWRRRRPHVLGAAPLQVVNLPPTGQAQAPAHEPHLPHFVPILINQALLPPSRLSAPPAVLSALPEMPPADPQPLQFVGPLFRQPQAPVPPIMVTWQPLPTEVPPLQLVGPLLRQQQAPYPMLVVPSEGREWDAQQVLVYQAPRRPPPLPPAHVWAPNVQAVPLEDAVSVQRFLPLLYRGPGFFTGPPSFPPIYAGTWVELARGLVWQPEQALVKRSAEVRLYKMDFASLLDPFDIVAQAFSVSWQSLATSPQGANLVLGDPTIDANLLRVAVLIGGGSDAGLYAVMFQAQSASGDVLDAVGYLYVDDA